MAGSEQGEESDNDFGEITKGQITWDLDSHSQDVRFAAPE